MSSRKARILCTEDDPDTRDLIKVILGGEGHDVITAESARQALHLTESESFDLYLIDNWVPGLSGDELTRRIREHDSETPLPFYSGDAPNLLKKARALPVRRVTWSNLLVLMNSLTRLLDSSPKAKIARLLGA